MALPTHTLNASETSQSPHSQIENLSLDIEDILAQHIDINYLKSDFALSATQKNDIIKTLYDKGIFNIKAKLYLVAKLLKILGPSVYRYLNKLKRAEG
ncbi:helix-turn-helix domain-containing protein [Campylobacter troglodytis]|uniref:helix-turn-helix domain-containing protein n=1 Tax=Campylobacter troglodytis TaxID=654363 RepID=UPI001FE59B04|nr:helix-turn-helix domain-containing protein [Campylobacter troglodytis]